MHVAAFKVLKTNKYKTTLEVVRTTHHPTDPVRTGTYEVTATRFDQFIQEVYDWQNGGSQLNNENVTKRFNSHYKKTA